MLGVLSHKDMTGSVTGSGRSSTAVIIVSRFFLVTSNVKRSCSPFILFSNTSGLVLAASIINLGHGVERVWARRVSGVGLRKVC